MNELTDELTDGQLDRLTDEQTDGLTDGRTYGLTNEQTDRQTDRWTIQQTFRQTDLRMDRLIIELANERTYKRTGGNLGFKCMVYKNSLTKAVQKSYPKNRGSKSMIFIGYKFCSSQPNQLFLNLRKALLYFKLSVTL